MLNKIISLTILLVSLPVFANDEVPKPNLLQGLAPIIVIFFILYFFMIRPQQKKTKEREKMVDSLKVGNLVVTDSGIYGTVSKINSKEGLILLEVSKGVVIKIRKQNIVDLGEKNSSASKLNKSPKIVSKSAKVKR